MPGRCSSATQQRWSDSPGRRSLSVHWLLLLVEFGAPSALLPVIVQWGAVASVESKIRQAWSMRRRCRRVSASRSSFAGFRFPPDVITIAVRWYLRYGLSYRDVEELLAERGVQVDHVTVFRWVQRFTPLLIDAARAADTPRAIGGLWTRRM